jgi:hypothetical protein
MSAKYVIGKDKARAYGTGEYELNKTKEENVEQAKKELRLQGGFVDEPESKFKLSAERRLTKVWNALSDLIPMLLADIILIGITVCVWCLY